MGMPYKYPLTEEQRLQRNKCARACHVKTRDKILARRRELYVQNNLVEYARKQRKKYGPAYQAALNKRYREKNPEKVAKIQKNYKDRVRSALNALKVTTGCVDCGFNAHPAALEFDHVSGVKRTCVSLCGSVSAALLEAAKCVVRCSNCHRIATANRHQYRDWYNKPKTS